MSSPSDPAGIDAPLVVRAARPEDYEVFVRLFRELALEEAPREKDRWEREVMATTLIAEAASGDSPAGTLPRPVLGYAYFQIIRDTAYVRHLVTDPSVRRRGVGKVLMTAIAQRALAHEPPCSAWCINVRPDNVAAVALYERMGMTRQFETRALRVPWTMVDARQTLHDARVLARVIAPEDDARVEPAMKLLSGHLATSRRMEGRILIGLFDDETVLGATVFDPTFPGAYPFRVTTPELALVLLDALRPYARKGDALVHVVVEGQPDVADALIAAGATVKLDIVHMSSSTIATAVPVAATR
jgi:ribosomal protein S18 acetylase RimI-like enzyme